MLLEAFSAEHCKNNAIKSAVTGFLIYVSLKELIVVRNEEHFSYVCIQKQKGKNE